MTLTPARALGQLAGRLKHTITEPQHRDALYLMLNTGGMALAGFFFWLILTRLIALPEPTIGHGYAIISLGTAVAVIAKGGLDTAITRHAPGATRSQARALVWQGIGVGLLLGLLVTALLPVAASLGLSLPALGLAAWGLVLAIAAGLLVMWLQDAYFVAEREARMTFGRNLTAGVIRIFLPIALVALAIPQPVALAWALGVLLAGLLGVILARSLPDRQTGEVDPKAFWLTAIRNVTSSAAEFLPGLLLVPIVLAVHGAKVAAYFGIAWTLAHLIFQVSAAIGRSALVSFVREPETRHPKAVRRGLLQHALIVLPGATLAVVLAPWLLAIFGPAYAAGGATVLRIMAASILLVAPAYLYLALLRAREQVLGLLLWPLVTLSALFALVPLMPASLGLTGVAVAWCIANTPFGLWGAWRLYQEAREVSPDDDAPVDRRPHVG